VVIDVGCGTGANLADLAGPYRCVGIDTSEEAIRLARRRFPGVQYLVGHAPRDLGPWMSQARLVLLMDVLEHVSDDFALLSELFAASQPGTHFLLTVPADESLWSEHDESFGHFRRYDPSRFERVWAGLPAKTLLLSYFNSRLCPLVRLVRARNRWLGRATGRAGTDFWLPAAPINRLLAGIMAGEANRLARVLHGRGRGYAAGTSLVAVLRREEGRVNIRPKPANLPPDHLLSATAACG
jgi:SAM-dependent methyltransferase